jgi:predicted nucleotidyltransferase
MAINNLILEMREEILHIARRHGVGTLRVFGSAARREVTPDSDVDFLIEIERPTTPWFSGGLVTYLEALLGCSVDVVEAEALHEDLRENILQEAAAL